METLAASGIILSPAMIPKDIVMSVSNGQLGSQKMDR